MKRSFIPLPIAARGNASSTPISCTATAKTVDVSAQSSMRTDNEPSSVVQPANVMVDNLIGSNGADYQCDDVNNNHIELLTTVEEERGHDAVDGADEVTAIDLLDKEPVGDLQVDMLLDQANANTVESTLDTSTSDNINEIGTEAKKDSPHGTQRLTLDLNKIASKWSEVVQHIRPFGVFLAFGIFATVYLFMFHSNNAQEGSKECTVQKCFEEYFLELLGYGA